MTTSPALLVLDSCSTFSSVALLYKGQRYTVCNTVPRHHAKALLPMIDEVLGQAGTTLATLDAIAYTHGPGSFTGLRIVGSAVKALAYASKRPVIELSSLELTAQPAHRLHGLTNVLAVFDARLQQVSWGSCVLDDSGLMQPRHADAIALPTAVNVGGAEAIVGSGANLVDVPGATGLMRYADVEPLAEDGLGLAEAALAAGRLTTATDTSLVYLRNDVAHKKAG